MYKEAVYLDLPIPIILPVFSPEIKTTTSTRSPGRPREKSFSISRQDFLFHLQ